MNKKYLLVLNVGSSSLKFAVWQFNKKTLVKEILSGGLSPSARGFDFNYKVNNKQKKIHYSSAYNLKIAWRYIHDILVEYNIVYVGFRMVHGAEEFVDTTKINQAFITKVAKYNKLAPLHNPIALELIKLVKKTWPRLKMSASFDTAWYKSMLPENYLYSLPYKYYQKHKIRKYGFHGLSHEMATYLASQKTKKPLKKLQAITCHLGSGASISWYMNGQVKDTTMGFTPNEGLTMATRSGDLPPDVVLYLLEQLKMSPSRIKDLLNKESGLLGLAGTSDLREVLLASGYRVAGYRSSLKFSAKQKKQAKLALAIYVYDIKKYLASFVAMSPNLDAVVFAGVVGVHSLVIRKLVLNGVQLPKKVKILIAPDNENKNLANKTLKCLS